MATYKMGALLSLIFAADKKPHHLEGDCHCACDDASESSGSQVEPQLTSTKPAAVARDSPT
jgi:hypothetical protein